MTSLTHKAREIFSHDLYATESTGVKIEEAREGYARCSLTLTPLHRNAMGAVMGGVMFTLADLAFAIAANSHCLANNQPLQWVSLNSSIHYLGQTHTISIHDENDKPIAIVTTTGIHLN